MPASRPAAPRADLNGASLYGLYVIALVVCLIGNLLIRVGAEGGWLSSGLRVALGMIAAVPLAWAAVVFWRMLRRDLDEMLQRIVIEGMAFALVLYVPLAALYVNLRTAGAWMPRLDPPDILLLPALLVAIGIEISRRRFR